MSRLSSLFSLFLGVTIALLLSCNIVVQVQCETDQLTPEEVELVNQFRAITKDLTYKDWMTTDEYLVRWLRVRDNNIQAAREMLQAAMEWRKANDMDHILSEDFSDIEDELSITFEGEDNDGRPLMSINIGTLDIRKLVLGGRLKRLNRFFIYLLETTEAALRSMNAVEGAPGNVTRIFIIADLGGFNLRQHACVQCVPFLIHSLQTYETYHPDLAHRFIGINVPRTFMPIYELARPFLSTPSRNAIELFDSNSDRWKQRLLSEIPEDQLPVQFGGKRKVLSKSFGVLRKQHPVFKMVFEQVEAEEKQSKSKNNTTKSEGAMPIMPT